MYYDSQRNTPILKSTKIQGMREILRLGWALKIPGLKSSYGYLGWFTQTLEAQAQGGSHLQ